MRSLSHVLVIFAVLGTISVIGCGALNDIHQSVNEAVNSINQAITDIEIDNTRWQSIAQNLSDKLPKDLQSTIHTEVDQLAARTEARGGVVFRANVDFLAKRTIQHLRRIRAMLLKQPVDPVEPGFAQVVPETLDLSLEANRRGHITIYGYDMDSKDHNGDLPRFFLVAAKGSRLPLEDSRVGRATHYQITLDVSGSDFEKILRANDIRKIVCSWNGRNEVLSPKEYNDEQRDLSEILVTGRDPQRQVVSVPIGAISYTPRYAGGDADFCTKDGKPMHVRVIGQTRVNGNRIEARVYMWAQEHVPDHTTVEGWSSDVIVRYEERNLGLFRARVPVYGEGPWQTAYTAPKGWVIKGATPIGQTEHRDDIIGHGERDYNKAAGETVSRFKVWGDRDGDEAGTWTRLEVHFNAVTVDLEEIIPKQ